MILLAFDVRNAFHEFDQALAMLPDEESRAAVIRFKFEQDRHLALASQLLRRYLFAHLFGLEWDALRFGSLAKGGKPVLLNPPSAGTSYDFNISHHGHWVILAATDRLGYRVGVDVVTLDPPPASSSVAEFVKCFHPQLSPQEQLMLRHHPHPLEAFYAIWALKESYTKAMGVGLHHSLDQLSFYNSKEGSIRMSDAGAERPGWVFHMGWLDNMSLAAVCYGTDDDTAGATREPIVDADPVQIGDRFRGRVDKHFRIVTLQDCMGARIT